MKASLERSSAREPIRIRLYPSSETVWVSTWCHLVAKEDTPHMDNKVEPTIPPSLMIPSLSDNFSVLANDKLELVHQRERNHKS